MSLVPATWTEVHNPTATNVATITRAAPASTRRLIATHITVSMAAITATTAIVHAYLRDGATGAGTILWSAVLSAPTSGGMVISVPVNIPGSPGTAMTLEFDAGGSATSIQSVALQGRTE